MFLMKKCILVILLFLYHNVALKAYSRNKNVSVIFLFTSLPLFNNILQESFKTIPFIHSFLINKNNQADMNYSIL